MEYIIWKEWSILNNFFDESTMSVHFKENIHISRKKWKPGKRETEILDEKPTKNYINNIIKSLYKEIEENNDSFLEIDRNFSKVLQIWNFRIVVVLPPLSDWIEITAVKPIIKLNINDYSIEESILQTLRSQSQGILISGSPWEGKTTFAQALIELFVNDNNIVKTIESPRDLMVPDEVTQYSFSYAPHSEIRDILLLSRPDYTIYDEVRNIDDFNLFKDLRLAWIWLIGVIHATHFIDGIQRFLWNIEMWVIPQVIDTVIFVKWWTLDKVLQLKYSVKVPEWMESWDLSRPVIEVFDFMTNKIEYEIYSYWEETVVMPLDKIEEQKASKPSALIEYGTNYIQEYLEEKFKFPLKVEAEGENRIKLYVPDANKWNIIGKQWAKITELEKELGLSISVKTMEEEPPAGDNIEFEIFKKNKKDVLQLYLWKDYSKQNVMLKIGEDILTATADKNWNIKIRDNHVIQNAKNHWVILI